MPVQPVAAAHQAPNHQAPTLSARKSGIIDSSAVSRHIESISRNADMQSQRQSRSRVLEALPTGTALASHSLLPTLPDASDTVSLAVNYFPTQLN